MGLFFQVSSLHEALASVLGSQFRMEAATYPIPYSRTLYYLVLKYFFLFNKIDEKLQVV